MEREIFDFMVNRDYDTYSTWSFFFCISSGVIQYDLQDKGLRYVAQDYYITVVIEV